MPGHMLFPVGNSGFHPGSKRAEINKIQDNDVRHANNLEPLTLIKPIQFRNRSALAVILFGKAR